MANAKKGKKAAAESSSSIAEQVINVYKRSGLTREEFMDLIEISPTGFFRWENGDRTPPAYMPIYAQTLVDIKMKKPNNFEMMRYFTDDEFVSLAIAIRDDALKANGDITAVKPAFQNLYEYLTNHKYAMNAEFCRKRMHKCVIEGAKNVSPNEEIEDIAVKYGINLHVLSEVIGITYETLMNWKYERVKVQSKAIRYLRIAIINDRNFSTTNAEFIRKSSFDEICLFLKNIQDQALAANGDKNNIRYEYRKLKGFLFDKDLFFRGIYPFVETGAPCLLRICEASPIAYERKYAKKLVWQ